MIRIWFRRHWLRVVWIVGVTAAMILSYQSLIPLWIFYTLLIAMHVWIFSKIGLRIFEWTRNRNNK